MRRYLAEIYIEFNRYIKVIDAKNRSEAYLQALHYGYELSNYGQDRYLHKVSVTPLKKEDKR